MEPQVIIGVDEAGCGALAGPLVVAAVAFRREEPAVTATYRGLRSDHVITAGDSKGFSNPAHREVLGTAIRHVALGVSVVECAAEEIDQKLLSGVFPETLRLAVARVLEQLVAQGIGRSPQEYLVKFDGDIQIPDGIPCPKIAIPGGDKLVWQIGAASILAKVYRDHRMDALHALYPEWGFNQHRGYPTQAHKRLLARMEPSPAHRRTFKPVATARGLPPGFED